uniref:Uncharacterized protein n=1 Tax=Arundo donax TaxID=35708 RepID=A0A0A9B616_ARUDO
MTLMLEIQRPANDISLASLQQSSAF